MIGDIRQISRISARDVALRAWERSEHHDAHTYRRTASQPAC